MKQEEENKLAIFYSYPLKRRNGGPPTYLYNLRQGMIDTGLVEKFSFYVPEEESKYRYSIKLRTISWFVNKTKKVFHSDGLLRNLYYKLFEYIYIGSLEEKYTKNNGFFRDVLKQEKTIHFHSIFDLFYAKRSWGYTGKSILTMHAPEPIEDEIVNALKISENTEYDFPILRKYLSEVQEGACAYADAFIFPCKECEELYELWPFYKKNSKGKLVSYVYTGTVRNENSITTEEMKRNLRLDEGKKVFSYCGRHNKVKGYDLLVEAFKRCKKNNSIFICAGNIEDITPPKHSEWRELGWRNDIPNVLSCVDVLVLPNRSTYFDLMAIEAMAAGVVVLASNTGGNKALARLSKGVVLFENESIDDLMIKLDMFEELSLSSLNELKSQNLEVFNQYFCPEKFAENYFDTVNKIIKNWDVE